MERAREYTIGVSIQRFWGERRVGVVDIMKVLVSYELSRACSIAFSSDMKTRK